MIWTGGAAEDTGAGPDPAAVLADLMTTLPWMAEPRGGRVRILEAAGPGVCAGELVALGHTVVIMNASPEVLDTARERLLADPDRLVGTVSLTQGNIADVPQRWPPDAFDMILCHTVFERSIEPREVLAALAAVLKPGGYLSLAFSTAAPLHHLAAGDVAAAQSSLDVSQSGNGASAPALNADTVISWLADLELSLLSHRGIEVLGGLLPRVTPEGAAAAELEAALARYSHVVARKPVTFPMRL